MSKPEEKLSVKDVFKKQAKIHGGDLFYFLYVEGQGVQVNKVENNEEEIDRLLKSTIELDPLTMSDSLLPRLKSKNFK